MKINLDIESLPNKVEEYIIDQLNKNAPNIYAKITTKELDNIYDNTINKFPEVNIITKDIIKSIRSSWTKNHMITNHKNLMINSNKINEKYSNGIDILELSKIYDISPLNILRLVFKNKYNRKITKIINNKSILNSYDLKQLNKAIDNDIYALIDNSQIHKESVEFEKQIEHKLIELSIKYKTQEELVKEQIELYGKPTNTPDFLILSELEINGIKINWIDAKNFFGSNIQFIKKSIDNQTEKYINSYGSGCIIFNLGFNTKIHFKDILLVNFDSFNKLN